MSTTTEPDHNSRLLLGPRLTTGVLLLLVSVGLAFFAGDNVWAISLGWLIFLAAMMLTVMGLLQNRTLKRQLLRRVRGEATEQA